MSCTQLLEEYKGININKDNTIKKFKVYAIILKEQLKNPEGIVYSKILEGGSVEILKRKIDKVLKVYTTKRGLI